jgi:hypothetical protein
VALATDRCSYLTELQMGNLHEKVPGYEKIRPPRRTRLRAVKFTFFFVMDHKWTGNPDPGLHCISSGSRQVRHSTT